MLDLVFLLHSLQDQANLAYVIAIFIEIEVISDFLHEIWCYFPLVLLLKLFKFLVRLQRFYKNIIMKVASLGFSCRISEHAEAMLFSFVPESAVAAAISPGHYTVTLLLVSHVLADVLGAIFPLELTMPVLLVVMIHSSVLIATLLISSLSPVAKPVLHSISELAAVRVPVSPYVLSEAFSTAPHVISNKNVSGNELVASFAMAEAVLPCAFVFVS